MKLRIRGNSVRVRLGESEVAQLVESGRVSERVRFSAVPGESLTYTIASSAEAKEIAASFAENEIKVVVPAVAAKEWAGSTQVGMDRVQPIDADGGLSILIEKDFRCLAPRPGEDQTDSFAHPAAGQSCEPH
jgi:hypothetical protein